MPNPLESSKVAPSEDLLQISNVAVFLITLTAYIILAQIASILSNPLTNDDTFWPGSGLSLALLLMVPNRQWIWVILAIATGEYIGNLSSGFAFSANLFWISGNCIEPLVGAFLIRRSGNLNGALSPQGNMFRFLAYGVIVAPFVGASIGSIGTNQILGVPFWDSWPKWFIGDSLGVLIIAPIFLARIKPSNPLAWPKEQIVFAVTLFISTILILRNWSSFLDLVLPYLFLPFTLWAALRFGIRSTALTIFFIATAATVSISLGYLPYQTAVLEDFNGITMMQVRLHIVSSTALVVAALTHDLFQGMSNEKRLMRQAHRDELTGLYNRAGLNFRVESSNQRRRSDKPLHLLICDLDAFKPINDMYGHLAGDEVLIEVASRLSGCIRDGDAAARIGGDEFIVLLDNSDSQSAAFIAGRIIEQMAKPVRGRFGVVELSMSIGITQWDAETDIETAMQAADKALYQAKNEGKNRFVWAPKLS